MSWLNDLFGVPDVSDANAQAQLDAYNKQAQEYAAREANAYAQQGRLAGNLWSVINGGGPSVAGTQLTQGLDQTLTDANSMASGGTGVNGALARYAAILGAGRSMAATNSAAALLRAKEVADARAQLGGVIGAQAGESGNLYGTDVGAAGAAAALKTGIDENNQKADAALSGTFVNGLSSLGATAIGAATGAPVGGAPASTGTSNLLADNPANYGSLYSAAQPGYVASATAGQPANYGGLYSASAPGYAASRGAGPAPYGGGYGTNPYGDRY